MHRALVAPLVGLLVVAGCGGSSEKKQQPPGPPPPVKVKVDSGDKGTKPDVTVTVPRGVYDQTKKKLEGQDLKTEHLSKQAKQQLEQNAKKDKLPPNAGLGASDSVPGCVTRFVRNQSSRGGAAAREFVLHETVSPNVKGWADVNAVVALFDRSSASASSNFVEDHEGHCAYIVPLSRKAWTQASANPFAVSVEMIDTATRRDGSYCGGSVKSPGCAKLASVFRTVRARTPIASRQGNASGCFVRSSGITDHRSLGQCAGGHVDISPWSLPGNVKLILKGAGKGGGGGGGSCSVSAVQRALNSHGAKPKLAVDGSSGPKTKAAIVRFQRSHHLTPDGDVGPRTGKALGVKGC
jgi:hypothetical protein